MKTNAEVVIVGAGISGLSTAFHLARSGVKNIIVVERRHIASEATGKSGALVRVCYNNEPETRLAFESFQIWTNWQEIVGGDCGLRQVGLLALSRPEYDDQLKADVAMQKAVGANVELISDEEARQLDPSLWCDDVNLLYYEPDAGYADPSAAAYSLANAAKALGVEFRLETRVTRVLTKQNRVTGVDTTTGRVDAPVVVLSAGAWANHLLLPLGIDLGLRVLLGRICVFRWAMDRSPSHMTYIDRIHESWFRPIDGNCTLVGAESLYSYVNPDPDNYSETAPQAYVDKCREVLIRRFPVMRHGTMRGNWGGVVSLSPDSRPIIDQLPGYEGLFCMTGDSGTSFKTGPAIGKALAEWITDGEPATLDLRPFRSTRFSEGDAWQDAGSMSGQSPTISR